MPRGGGLKFVAFGILHTAKAFYYTVKKHGFIDMIKIIYREEVFF